MVPPNTINFCLFAFFMATTVLHILSAIVVILRANRSVPLRHDVPLPNVTIVRPISCNDQYLLETLKSTFELSAGNYEIIFCAARVSDPAVEVARRLIAVYPHVRARLLIGDDRISQNPKLNNCVKGWRAAQSDYVVLIDSNVLLPRTYLSEMFDAWNFDCGLVSSPPVGDAPGSFWATVECAFLNTHQARWQLFADELGLGFAQGKNLMFQKSMLESVGGLARLAHEPAEDAAATKVVRAAGLKVRLANRPFSQLLGKRNFPELLQRQIRWARLRRMTFARYYLPEVFSGSVLPMAAAVGLAWRTGHDALLVAGMILVIWYGTEVILARCMRWNVSPASPFSMIVRDLLLPVIWMAGWVSNSFEWQGHQMSGKREAPPVAAEPQM